MIWHTLTHGNASSTTVAKFDTSSCNCYQSQFCGHIVGNGWLMWIVQSGMLSSEVRHRPDTFCTRLFFTSYRKSLRSNLDHLISSRVSCPVLMIAEAWYSRWTSSSKRGIKLKHSPNCITAHSGPCAEKQGKCNPDVICVSWCTKAWFASWV